MRRRLIHVLGIGVLFLVAGCVTGAGLGADLPQARPLPMLHSLTDIGTPPEKATPPDGFITLHPPDAPLIAREATPRPFTRLDAALLGLSNGIGWYWFLPVLAF
jgi:hypothetical protein